MTFKICSDQRGCQNPNPQSVLRFNKDKDAKDGLAWECRKCSARRQRDYKQRNGMLTGVGRL